MTDEAADLAEQIRRARDALDRALALIEAQRGGGEHASAPEWGTMGQAATLRHCTEQTMARLVIAHGLGTKTAGRWRVDLERVRRWQAGEPYEPLDPFPDG